MLGRLTSIALIAAVAFGAGAWQLQANAAADMKRAVELQVKEIHEPDATAPSPEDHRKIIDSLLHATDIRRTIEQQLQTIENTVTALQAEQQRAESTSAQARADLEGIAAALGGATLSASDSDKSLQLLRARLARSARLARAIAEELEELDRKMGPPGGGAR